MKNILRFLITVISINKNFIYLHRINEVTKNIDSGLFKHTSPVNNTKVFDINLEVLIGGLRLESLDVYEYSIRGVPIVKANTKVKIGIFGYNLQEIDIIGFTKYNNCHYITHNISKHQFISVTKKKITLETVFHDIKSLYMLCYHLSKESSDKTYTHVGGIDCTISTDYREEKHFMPFSIQLITIVFLIMLSGLFSGLNLGLMTLTPHELELIYKSGSKTEKKYAEVIIPIRKSGNLLLCSLLIGNVIVNSAISILIDNLTSGIVALIVASAGIVVFGEIFPQSLCVKKGLAVGAKTIWITKFIIIITFPVAYPISKILDLFIDVEVISYDRKKIMELIKMTTKYESNLGEELKIAVGAMEIADKIVKDVMTKIEDVLMLPETMVLNPNTVTKIVNTGYTRIPVYRDNDKNNVVSLLFIKDLALVDPDENFTVKTVCTHHHHILRFIYEDTPLKTMLEEFKKGDYHLAMVKKRNNDQGIEELCGLVTLEDILEEILKAEIIDETDVIIDNVHKIRRKTRNKNYLSNCCRKKVNMEVKTSKSNISLPAKTTKKS